jgi:hypothetical protein
MSTTICFQAIHDFVLELDSSFGEEFHPLHLYKCLIERTTFSHKMAMSKHIDSFKTFIDNNWTALSDNVNVTGRIIFSERVYIDIEQIMSKASVEVREVIRQHLLTIAGLINPASDARKMLRELGDKNDAKTEGDILSTIMTKIEQNIDLSETSNPMEAVGKMMSSGVFADLVGSLNKSIESGELDVAKMIGMVQTLSSQAQPEAKIA